MNEQNKAAEEFVGLMSSGYLIGVVICEPLLAFAIGYKPNIDGARLGMVCAGLVWGR